MFCVINLLIIILMLGRVLTELMEDENKKELTEEDRNIFITSHNDYRRQAYASNMKQISWDSKLEHMGQLWANNCIWKHGQPVGITTSYNQIGQNMWMHTGGYSAFDSTEWWYNEISAYNYKTGDCSSVCGHYTQVVWADTHKIGCGIKFCPSGIQGSTIHGSSYFIVCNYGPAGNWVGEKPYDLGTPCSKCIDIGFEQCKDGLCTGDGTEYIQATSNKNDHQYNNYNRTSNNGTTNLKSFILFVLIIMNLIVTYF